MFAKLRGLYSLIRDSVQNNYPARLYYPGKIRIGTNITEAPDSIAYYYDVIRRLFGLRWVWLHTGTVGADGKTDIIK